MRCHSLIAAGLLSMALAQSSLAVADTEYNPVARQPRTSESPVTLGVIVKLRKDGAGAAISKLANGADRSAALAKRTGLMLGFRREISDSMLANTLELGDSNAAQILERLRADPAVEYVSVDRRRFPHATTPNDALFPYQWYLSDVQPSSVNAIGAWDREVGATGVVIAVIDTGVLYDHPDLGRGDQGGKLLPGYDFVTASHMSNDGDGRDADPSDPGDWVDSSDKSGNTAFSNCDITNSSWHGTRVAGMIGALTNNSVGIAGIDWNSFILPVRVMGKCGGLDSDILAGMRWAAGFHVAGVPDNPTPARVLNLSLGSDGACEPSYQDVIAELTSRKAVAVVSAGNEGTVVSAPANCVGVVAVAAIRHVGSKVGFSSLGLEVTVAAPGGNCVNLNGGPCVYSLDTTSNFGAKAPTVNTFTDQFNSNLGTSFSAPIVSGIAALMLSRNANLSSAQLIARLREGAQPFPASVGEPSIPICHVPQSALDVQLAQCICTSTTCGAGMANAAGSVAAAERPIVAIALPATVSAGQEVSLNASASAAACGRTVASFEWTIVSPGVAPPAVSDANTSTATVIAPASGSFRLRVTVTDDQGLTDFADVTVRPSNVATAAPVSAGTESCATPVTSGPTPVATPPNPNPNPNPTPTPTPTPRSGGGGGGSIGLTTLTLLGGLCLARTRRRFARISRCNW